MEVFATQTQSGNQPDAPSLKFAHLSVRDGLSDTEIMTIVQDHQGFMWFGTQQGGLNRYDGYGFRIYKNDHEDETSLSNNFIWSMFEDSKNHLWIGTNGGGLNLYDRSSDSFICYPIGPSGVPHYNIKSITEDADGTLWVGGSSPNGFSKFNRDTGEFFTYHTEGDDGIRAIHQDRETGHLWLGTYDYGVLVFDIETEEFVCNYPFDPNNPNMISSNTIEQITQNRNGDLWITTNHGLNRFNRKTETFTRYFNDPDDPASLSDNQVERMLEDSNGRFWITSPDGLNLFQPDSETFTTYFHNPNDTKSLSDSYTRPLFEDNSGALWVGTGNDGVNRLNGEPEKFHLYDSNLANLTSLSGNYVKALYVDSRGDIWVGTTQGLNHFDGRTFTRYLHDPDDPTSISNNFINAIVESPQGGIWVTTNKGLSYFDGQGFINYQHDPGNPESIGGQVIIDAFPDGYGGLWLSIYGVGMDYFDGQTFTHYRPGQADSGEITSAWPYDIVKDAHCHRIWICTFGDILALDPETKTFTHIFPTPKLQGNIPPNQSITIYQEKSGLLWIGGGQSGLMLFDLATGQIIQHYTKNDGLADNNVRSIIGDEQGQLWVSTQNGLSRFDPQNGTFRNYYAADGLQSNQLTTSIITPDGQIFIGGPNGLNSFYPNRLKDNPHIPPIVLTDFRLFNKPVPIGGDSPLQQAIWATDVITLLPEDYVFSLEFAALNYHNPQQNRYKYKLEGFDPDWNEVDSRRRVATYTSLPGGEYTFQVLGSNNDGVWNEEGVSLKITVQPPLWEKLRLEKEAAEAANQAKSEFLANMSHELRTPLNSILGFAQILQHQSADREVRKRLGMIHQSGEHLLTLINDILDLSRIEAGKLALDPQPIHLPGFLETIAHIIREWAEAKDLLLVYEGDETLPTGVLVDETRLRQVLLNLLGNAVKFTDEGQVTLRAAVSRQPVAESQEANGYRLVAIHFEVEDTGLGISPDQLETIFQPFEQVGEVSRRQEGTGLGLAISRELVQLMGGDIQVESTPGQGSRFWFEVTLPLTAGAVPVEEVQTQVISGYEGPRLRVLVVDDIELNRALLVDMLAPLGFETVEAEDGRQALELAQTHPPDLILMDRRMPVMDGLEAIQQLRQIPELAETPVISISASVSERDRAEIMAAGYNAFLPKPVSWPDLAAQLEAHLPLAWTYEEVATEGEVGESEAELVLPPRADLEALYELAQFGSISRIQDWVQALAERDEKYHPLAAKLAHLAESYEIEQINRLARQYLAEAGE